MKGVNILDATIQLLMRALFIRIIAVYFGVLTFAQGQMNSAVFLQEKSAWVDSLMTSMTLDEKIGQLFMVAAYSNKGESHQNEILNLIKNENLGGLIFFQGTAKRQAELTNFYQQAAKVPLMIAMDAEWGLAMRLPETFKFPWPITVGAISDEKWAYEYGKAMAVHCKRLGVHINFAPAVDINTNPLNPIIGARSFGENPQKVTEMATAFMNGLQSEHVLACAKHFPGHGDTDSDSHKTLPTVSHDRSRLDAIELYPYQKLAKTGLGGVMVAHLNVPALDASGTPSSLSKDIVGLLKNELGFGGLVFTDALNMQGVAAKYAPGMVDLEAVKAGNEVLVFSQNVHLAKEKILAAINDGSLDAAEIEKSVRKILMAKNWFGLSQKKYVEPNKINQDLNTIQDEVLNRRLFAEATTLLVNKDKTLPIRDLSSKKIACITAGVEEGSVFPNTLKKYTQVEHFSYSKNREEEIIAALSDYDYVIFGLYTSNANPWKSYRISDEVKRFIRRVSLQNKLIIDVFGNPYGLIDFPEARRAEALLVSYQNHSDAESIGAQIIFGALGAKGHLPVSAGEPFEPGFGLNTEAIGRMGFALPEEVDMDATKLAQIDNIVEDAIRQRATPGAQVLVARHGKVIYNKVFGSQDYSDKHPVGFEDLYDIASITKIAVSVPLLMKLVEEGKINLDKTLGDYLSITKGTNKEDMVLREILAHKAGLQAWIPFYTRTLEAGKYKKGYYSTSRDFNFPNVVNEGLYSSRYIRDTVIQVVLDSKLRDTRDYKYSDLGYYLFMELIEQVEGRPIDELIHEFLYAPMGAFSLTYEPTKIFPIEQIVPTEDDKVFRKAMVRGYVHDQGSALIGGVAGHAGLFGNANDLAKLMQMYMQKGEYAGIRYFDSVTVNEFIRCQYCDEKNRRGIGFDKPQLGGAGPTCGCVSDKSFGHSGFTGTLAWADPEEEIVYIFLSNRVYPDAANQKLLSLSTRTKIQEVIYEAINTEHSSTKLLGLNP
jgi:beta-N-acetylhexosaminidase